jgi:hypothetical protein
MCIYIRYVLGPKFINREQFVSDYEKKVYKVMVNNSTNINTTNNHLIINTCTQVVRLKPEVGIDYLE